MNIHAALYGAMKRIVQIGLDYEDKSTSEQNADRVGTLRDILEIASDVMDDVHAGIMGDGLRQYGMIEPEPQTDRTASSTAEPTRATMEDD